MAVYPPHHMGTLIKIHENYPASEHKNSQLSNASHRIRNGQRSFNWHCGAPLSARHTRSPRKLYTHTHTAHTYNIHNRQLTHIHKFYCCTGHELTVLCVCEYIPSFNVTQTTNTHLIIVHKYSNMYNTIRIIYIHIDNAHDCLCI